MRKGEKMEIIDNRIPGYEGICAECFWPVETGKGYRFLEKGRLFHIKCVDAHPNGYYVKLERRRAKRAKAVA
jgi:hypothetical protein